MPVCNLISDEERYAGQVVLVAGLYASTPHGGELYSPECSRSVTLNGSSAARRYERVDRVIKAAFIRNEAARVPVAVSGVFQPSVRWENGKRVVYANGPFIEESSFVAARQPSR